MLTPMFGERELGLWDGDPRHHMLLGEAPFYGSYQCADGKWFSVGAIEPKFYATMLELLDLKDVDAQAQMDQPAWPALRGRVAAVFRTRTQAEWTARFATEDTCGAPVLAYDDLARDPHLTARQTVRQVGASLQAAPAPRLSAHPDLVAELPTRSTRSAAEILTDAGFAQEEIDALVQQNVLWSA